MPLKRAAARDEMLTLLKDAMETIEDLDLKNVGWDDVRVDLPPESTSPPLPWAKVIIQHQTGRQDSLSNRSGKRSYERRGILTVQYFTPVGDGLTKSDPDVEIIENAIKGVSTPNGVWLRNARSQEIGVDGPWFQTNVLADFIYTQVS